jgi:hypothetical protein
MGTKVLKIIVPKKVLITLNLARVNPYRSRLEGASRNY